jgi:hypothetical protein
MTTSKQPSVFVRHRFPAEIIAHVVWLYFRFLLSLRMVDEMLAARGIGISHETVRQWALKFGRLFAVSLRRRQPKAGDKWHLVWGFCCQDLSSCFHIVRPIGSSRFVSTTEMTIRGGARSRAITARNLVFGCPWRGRTMMQLCASTAKLQAGGPNLHTGMKAIDFYGMT